MPAKRARRRGACAPFADPRLTATQVHPVWLARTETDTLRLTAHAAHGQAHAGLLVAALPNVDHILIDALGRHHVVLHRGTVSVHLVISGQGAVIGPVALGFQLHQQHDIGVIAEQLATLQKLLSVSGDVVPPPWTAPRERLRDGLIALDGHRAGATLREIATIIYGRERIDRDWPHKGLRKRMDRNLRRALALCNGGYRQLLIR